ncbi:MAG: hypothetical protein ACKV2T_38315 [Kofleriaceae bacterium]
MEEVRRATSSSFPDVTMAPSHANPVPIPYPNVSLDPPTPSVPAPLTAHSNAWGHFAEERSERDNSQSLSFDLQSMLSKHEQGMNAWSNVISRMSNAGDNAIDSLSGARSGSNTHKGAGIANSIFSMGARVGTSTANNALNKTRSAHERGRSALGKVETTTKGVLNEMRREHEREERKKGDSVSNTRTATTSTFGKAAGVLRDINGAVRGLGGDGGDVTTPSGASNTDNPVDEIGGHIGGAVDEVQGAAEDATEDGEGAVDDVVEVFNDVTNNGGGGGNTWPF